MVSRANGSARRAVVTVIGVTMLVAGLAPTRAAGAEVQREDPIATEKVGPQLLHELESSTTAPFWIRFEASADLSAASRIGDWVERGRRVAAALRETAEASQAEVREQLDREGIDYTSFWATNAIYVPNGSLDLAAELAAIPGVDSLEPTRAYSVPEPTESEAVPQAGAVEWGIANINADDVWAEYDVHGEGIVVANIDTGVQYNHPALVEQYRGNNGDGTFDHNYNWFDAAGVCGPAPCDPNGHGTHTMGTMAGDDGGNNRIGVAPGVTWIAANGCCPSDAALIASGQWMLEPTDLNGQNPDASKRPHIINNSWGSEIPSNDPFMEDIARAWAASGIFATWSNGNNGPACRTSGSPGSLIANYSVGAYDINNQIADFSSRGAGEDAAVKPNISAPGVAVRSAYRNGTYQVLEGTSMAAPHVAGAVALLWSAAPGLVGFVDETRNLLDGTAVDTPDDQCGGSDADNNVYGEGRLDALAMLDAAQVRDNGTLVISVADATTGDPIAGATIGIAGPVERVRTTGADGTYSLPLPAGNYTVSVTAFGYPNHTTTVTITPGVTTTLPLELEPQPRADVSGRVVDGSGHGWPLYAKITVSGMPGGVFYTSPGDGTYALSLPVDAEYTLTVEPLYGGYETVTHDIAVERGDLTHNVVVPVDGVHCTAEGYGYRYDRAHETFDDGLPDGWSVVDHAGVGTAWRFDDPSDRGNLTGGEGGFAAAQSPGGIVIDTSLVTAPYDLGATAAPMIEFRQAFHRLRETADLDISIDGGQTWETVLSQDSSVPGPELTVVPIPQAAGEPDVRVRFHYREALFSSRYWQIDDVFVGTRSCEPEPGGLLVGHVRDRNTGEELNGATIVRDDVPEETATSMATPDDPGLADGFYWLFTSARGEYGFAARIDGYYADRETIDIASSGTTTRDFYLPAGRLSVKHGNIAVSSRLGTWKQRKFMVTNTGSAPATVEFREGNAVVDLAFTYAGWSVEGVGAPVTRIEGDYSPLGFTGSGQSIPAARSGSTSSDNPWLDLPEYPMHIMDNAVGEFGGKVYSVGGVDGVEITDRGFALDPATGSWTSIAPLPEGRENAAGAFIDGVFYVVGGWDPGVRTTRTTFAYDPGTDTWSRRADDPVSAAAAGHAVLDGKLYLIGGCTNACGLDDVRRYDPATDSWQILAPYPVITAHLACAGIADKVYCAGGLRRGGVVWDHTYAYDPATDTWTRMADLPIQLWGMGYTGSYDRLLVSGGITGGARDLGQPSQPTAITNEGFVYDPESDTWVRLPPSTHVFYRGGSTCGLYRVGGSIRQGFNPVAAGELLPTYGHCAPVDTEWMALDTTSVTLAPGETVKVTVDLMADVPEQGTYEAGIWIKEDTPYLLQPVRVRMDVHEHGNAGRIPEAMVG